MSSAERYRRWGGRERSRRAADCDRHLAIPARGCGGAASACASAGHGRGNGMPAERARNSPAMVRQHRFPMPDATRRCLPSATGRRHVLRYCGISPVVRTAAATTAGGCPVRCAHNGSPRESGRPSGRSATPDASGLVERKSAYSASLSRSPRMSKGWASHGSSRLILARFPPMSVDFCGYANWPPRFANNWTHRCRCIAEAAQSPCRFCPKRSLAV